MSTATSIENGRRFRFDHPSCAGLAGFVSADDRHVLAYEATRSKPPQPGDEIDLEVGRFMVETVNESRRPRTVTLGLSPVA